MRLKHSRISRVLAALAAVAIALPPSLPVAAGQAMEKLFLIMKAKGSLSQEEYDLLVAASREEDKERDKAAEAVAPTPTPAPAAGQTPNTSSLEKRLAQAESKVVNLENALAPGHLEKRLAQTESKVGNLENALTSTRGQIEDISKITDNTSPSTMSASELDSMLADKWYERLKFKGYAQLRGDAVLHESSSLNVPLDPMASTQAGLGIRRGRFVLGGDVTSHLYLYMQADYFGSIGGVSQNMIQTRDLYGDISLDPAREFRVRLGQSKIPYGWSNMQSSQNRLSIERSDAINSSVEGERDFGAFFYWAPYKIRERFKDLVKTGLRGSGDYGVFAFGLYNGQGGNKVDLNGQPHIVSRLTYPFEFDNGQFLELSVQGYTGRFVPTVAPIAGAGTTPTVAGSRGVNDSRVGVSAILYPQPFGLEAEWNWGQGPQLSADMTKIYAQSLSGGYVQACYRHVFPNQAELIPFARWQTYDGARKMATNTPSDKTNEIGVGLRFIPYPELELSAMYMHGSRTNTIAVPYNLVNYDYIALQAQINY